MIFEAIRIALRSIRANKMRTVLTVLGNIISVAALVLVVSFTQGMNAEVAKRILSRGADTFYVLRHGHPRSEEEWERVKDRPPVTPEDADAIRRDAPLAAHVMSQWRFPATVKSPRQSVSQVAIEAKSASYPAFLEEPIDTGRHFTEMEEERRVPVALIGSELAEALFPGQPAIGRTIRLADRHFDVIGVMKTRGAFLGQTQDKYVIVPFRTAMQEWGKPWNIEIAIRPPTPEQLDAAVDEVHGVLRAHRRLRPSQESTFELAAAAQFLKMYEQSTSAIWGALIGLVSLALVVGGIVIANVMLMIVTQRTREIGIRKALGATRGQILWQFVMESITLSLFGGLAGFALGAGVTEIVDAMTPMTFKIEAWSVAAGFALVTVVGLCAGLYPATRASRLDPVVALRFER